MEEKTICKLCKNSAKLKKSHVVPKFVFNWMKDSGTGRFRNVKKFNIPIQDGFKEYLLCSSCEELFSKNEKLFKENVFDRFLNGTESEFKNEPPLIYFSVSVLWRVLVYCRNDVSQKGKIEFELAEEEWRDYLLGKRMLNQFSNIHFLFIPEKWKNEENIENLYLYLHRAVDICVGQINAKSFVFAKFSRFILIGQVSGIEESDFIGTNLDQIETLKYPQKINDVDIPNFIFNRVNNLKDYDDLSSNQKIQNDNFYKGKLNQLKGNDYWRVLKKDGK
jgi:hypothetical protein